MTDRFGNALPLTINPPNVLIHRLPIARNRAQDIYILTFPSRFRSTFLYSFVLPVSGQGKTSRREQVKNKSTNARLECVASRRSVISPLIRDSRSLPLSPFETRVPFCLGNTPYCPFYAGLPACTLQKIFYSHRPIVRHCVPAHCVPLCSFILRSVTR